MKKTLLAIVGCVFLAACASGINHNTAFMNGKPYLIESATRNAFGVVQWVEYTKYYSLEAEINKSKTDEAFQKDCEKEITGRNKGSIEYADKLQKCIQQKRGF